MGFSEIEKLCSQNRVALLWGGYVVACVLLLVGVLDQDGAVQPVPYPIREMMISYADGFVRRGLSGQVIIWASGWFGGNPAYWAYALCCLMGGALLMLTLGLYRRLPDDPVFLPLVLAPWGLMFAAYDADGSFRKEILGYIALLLLLRACFAMSERRARVWAIVGAVAFVMALLVHEAIVMLAPVFLMACGLLIWQFPALRRFGVGLAAVSAVASGAVVVTLLLMPDRDPAVLCAAVGDVRCGDPYAWMARSFGDGVRYVIRRREFLELPFFAIFAGLAIWPLAGFRVQGWSRRVHWLALGVCAICIAPLFVTAFDWGRWIQMIVFPLCLVGLAAVALGKAAYVRVLPAWAVVVYIGSVTLPHANVDIILSAIVIWPMLAAVVVLQRLRTGRWA